MCTHRTWAFKCVFNVCTTVSSSVRFLIADHASRVTVNSGARTVERVLSACFKRLRQHSLWCFVSRSVRFLIADRASRVTLKAIAL